MSKEARPLSRREALKVALLGFGSLAFPKQETPPIHDGIIDVGPEKTVEYAVWPLDGKPEEMMGDGKNPANGYTHLMATIMIGGEKDGGHHIGIDFNKGDFDDDCGEPLKMVMDGVCVFAGDGEGRQLGKIAVFCHKLPDSSLVYSRYAHLDSWNVEVGKNYEPGEIVGLMGKTGSQQKGFCHLHLDLARRVTFEKHYLYDPWWYPHLAPVWYQEEHYLDPAEIIKQYDQVNLLKKLREEGWGLNPRLYLKR